MQTDAHKRGQVPEASTPTPGRRSLRQLKNRGKGSANLQP